jgi:hypothetical protein
MSDGPATPRPVSDAASVPAGPRPARWYHLLADGSQLGPVALTDVRELVLEGSIGPETWIWADGMDDWLPARLVPALVPPPALRATLAAWPEEDREG